MEQAFKNMLEKHKPEMVSRQGTVGQKQVVAIIEDKKFWRDLEVYTPLAEPYNQVCQAMQAKDSSLADAGRYLILIAKTLKLAADDTSLDPDFLAHAYTVYNRRWLQMGTPLIQLALFLHLGYRVVGNQIDEFKALCMQAAELCADRGFGSTAIQVLWNDMDKYRSQQDPFSSVLAESDTPDMWWTRCSRQDPNQLLAKVARSVLSITPHAADPERAFSFMGMTHSSICNRFKASTVGSMAQIKSYMLIRPPDEEEFKPKDEKPKGKQQRTMSSADAGALEVTDLTRYKMLNPQPPQNAAATADGQLSDNIEQAQLEAQEEEDLSNEEVEDFFCATLDFEQKDAAEARQDRLDVELHYDIQAAFWEGKYLTLGQQEECLAFGDEADAKDVDLAALLAETFDY
ncbi:hypothetical protein ABBQ32_004464 [Trebouxia sp. C0010 RCD-2024]